MHPPGVRELYSSLFQVFKTPIEQLVYSEWLAAPCLLADKVICKKRRNIEYLKSLLINSISYK